MPDCYSTDDWSRSYLLPDHVTTNIALHGSEGEPGAHNNARGLLVEICLATRARPLALHYTDSDSPEAGLTHITALATLPDRNRPLLVSTSCRYSLRGDAPDEWSICIDHTHLATEDRRFPPSPPWQAGIVTHWLRAPDPHITFPAVRPHGGTPG